MSYKFYILKLVGVNALFCSQNYCDRYSGIRHDSFQAGGLFVLNVVIFAVAVTFSVEMRLTT